LRPLYWKTWAIASSPSGGGSERSGSSGGVTSPGGPWSGEEWQPRERAIGGEVGVTVTDLAVLLLVLGIARLIQLEVRARRSARTLADGSQALKNEIARRAEIEEALRNAQTRFWALTQSTGDAVVSIDSRGIVVFWGGNAERMFGYSESEVMGQPLTMIMPERYRDAHRRGLERISIGGEPRLIGRTVDFAGLTRSGGELSIELTLSSWRAGGESFYTGIMRDVSERRKKAELVSSISHELRTPLTTIKGFIELIAEGDAGPVTDTQREFLEITARSADRLSSLINDLLEGGGRTWRESS
jgi:PAS domain S-box-containing protein